MKAMQLVGYGDPPRFDLREVPDPDIPGAPTPGTFAECVLVLATSVVSRPGSHTVSSLRAAEA
ncbi:MAG: hypothetical protein ACYCST_14995 [Acidimicrobiales bacterium]